MIGLLRGREMYLCERPAAGSGRDGQAHDMFNAATSAEQALQLMVNAQAPPGVPEPVDAIRSAYRELSAHQRATTLAAREAFRRLALRVAPESLEAAAGPARGLARHIAVIGDAALWRRHRLEHERLLAELDGAFESEFAREFQRAYEAELKAAATGEARPRR